MKCPQYYQELKKQAAKKFSRIFENKSGLGIALPKKEKTLKRIINNK